ncbi:AbrB/MazE/SpoVT family DNA-binding domain-containing protein [Brasilonema sp. CT11]|nr:AbrB/MazE/SpoVT family DNA-binding domain-containing protein [Brasilonema sp. CT11]
MNSEPIKTHLVRIGNSKGVRLPKALLAISGIEGAVEIVASEGSIMIRRASEVRRGWEAQFQEMSALGDDMLLLGDEPLTQWDKEEWEWK